MSLEFNAFNIHSSSGRCNDHLTITDGNGTSLFWFNCGSLTAPFTAFTSISDTINIKFVTDSYSTESGWSLSWTAVTPGECQDAWFEMSR